jgi:hypothetical protein
MSEPHVVGIQADLARADHQAAPLAERTRRERIPGLRAHPETLAFLAYRDTEPVGLAIGFLGYPTFAARPL